ncbi:MAG TPA: aldehyde dehydrogenase family protein [Solirubrobacteraceae bacterium]|jgi:RHH-type proline utilization regulon transcriptional repressor/proline dehydrogenase/delta 1-pyrroline-5-carboxylate dehydrogenase|nr:aldehyde dehydrogenase family protein [Solirubrobacteraceae bacterium]
MPTPFANEPILELRRAAVRASLGDALAAVDATLPVDVPVLIGHEGRSGDELSSTDPGAPSRVVATCAAAREAELGAAIAHARDGLSAWRATSAEGRASALVAAAAWMRERRLELAALEVRECAKPWVEADADVCEAIDFLEYYARAAIELGRGRELLQVPGERNELRFVPRGIVAVISPWNFPLAIPCGMSAAALAAGNAVVLKPAEQSPALALRLVQALRAGGVPADAVSLLPGLGEVGAALVRHPEVAAIAFTGSLPVGREIVRAAAEPVDGQRHFKQVIAELGGKNCVIVDSDADLDEAVPGIVGSAFAYAGQKCSAASRVLVHEAIADHLMERLGGAVRVLDVGQAETPGIDVPPVIEREAQERVARYIGIATEQGRIVAQAPAPSGDGWFCPPTVATDLPLGSPVLEEEIFGPVLAVQRVRDVEAACDVVDGLAFALTGGLYTRSPATVRHVRERTPVGNLYVNRGTTGAMVARQPFGGNRLSGTGLKAGGPDYLLQFVEQRAVSENTMRHGLEV